MIDQRPNIKNQKQDQKAKTELKYRAFYLSIAVIRLTENINSRQSTKIIFDQLIRSTTSIGANIVEVKGSSSKKEFLKFFEIALKSSQETKYWLAMLRELEPGHKEKINGFITETEEITKILSSSILTMKGKRSLNL